MQDASEAHTASSVLKRILLGPPIPTRRVADTLLPKILALPVFSSDALSSVAYATEEILVVLVAASAAATGLVLPIAAAVAALMAIVVASYRQTVRGYPHGGGAYIVAKRNLGTIPGLVAGAALLTDYVLTVTVSVTAGAFAVTSAIPGSGLRLELSLAFVALMTLANLRGLRESGSMFAVPTYGFIVSIITMSVVGLVRCVGGCPAAVTPSPLHAGAGPVGLFVILHAFSSGSTALTGVEAISNGVPAFREPKAKNAETVLATMGAIAIAMFLAISWLAVNTGARPSHQISIVAQVARAVLGPGIGFYAVQATTAAILIVAANTAFQDFPRLSSILARDTFMPRVFMNRGDRLVFSNGIVVLGIVSAALIVLFDAQLSKLIQLYVVGVFTAFTLSQTGMVRHWSRSRDPARRVRMVINGIGAIATGIVLVVITVTKFVEGAWIVTLAIPLIVGAFLLHRRSIRSLHARLDKGMVVVGAVVNRVILVSRDRGPSVAAALRDLRALRPERVREIVNEDKGRRLTEALRRLGEGEAFVTVAIPGLHHERRRCAGANAIDQVQRQLRDDPRFVFTQVPLVRTEIHSAPRRLAAIVLAERAADPEVTALRYARSIGATQTRVIHVALDPEGEQEDVRAEWARRNLEPPIEIVDAPLRHLGPPLIDEVQRMTADGDTAVQLIIPTVVRPHHLRFLEERQARYVEGLFQDWPHVMVSQVRFVI